MPSRPIIERVISGGQTGVDQAALFAAAKSGIPTGGWAPQGWLTETGPAPWLADFGLRESHSPGYPHRTEANVHNAHLTLWIGYGDSPGFHCTRNAATQHDRPFWNLGLPWENLEPQLLAFRITKHGAPTLNIAGNRESSSPGIFDATHSYLTHVFAHLGLSNP